MKKVVQFSAVEREGGKWSIRFHYDNGTSVELVGDDKEGMISNVIKEVRGVARV